jgi:alpha/beta hydrolase family protein
MVAIGSNATLIRRSDESFRRPAPFLTGFEAPRALMEFTASVATLPLLAMAPRGGGEPVLVLPGLGGGDRSTGPLRWYLRELGYRPYGWGLGRNVGTNRRIVEGTEAQLRAIADQHEQPVRLIGWSLGGLYARELASEAPELVRQVVTLGSPHRLFRREHDDADADSLTGQWPEIVDTVVRSYDRVPRTPIVPTTAVYSRTDGVVPWRACLVETGPASENIEVFGSHFGFGHNPAVLWVIADRLAQPDGEWAPYRAMPFTWARAS